MSQLKFITDLTWSYFAFFIMAISGLVMNIIIGNTFNAEGVGIFNQSYAVYVISSQLAVGGVHLAVFKYASEYSAQSEVLSKVISSGLLLSLILAVICSSLLYFLSLSISSLFSSHLTRNCLVNLSPALFFFSGNKVLLLALNALRKMKAHSIFQLLRYFVLLISVIVIVESGGDLPDVIFCFLVSEVIVFLLLCIFLKKSNIFSFFDVSFIWLKKCLFFGVKGLWSGLAAEVNIRVDVLIVGLFLSDKAVGIYSFSAMLFEGVLNVIYVLRSNLNPMLVDILKSRKWGELKKMILNVAKWCYPVAVVLFLGTLFFYEYFILIIFEDVSFVQGYHVLLVLLLSLMLLAGFLPFDQLLLQAGFSGQYSIMMIISFITNLSLNLILVPQVGLIGAAWATGVSLLVAVIYCVVKAGKLLNLNYKSLFRY